MAESALDAPGPEVFLMLHSRSLAADPAHAAQRAHAPLQGLAAPVDPARTVQPRKGATAAPDVVHVRAGAAIKHNTFPSWSGHPSGRAHWQTHLHVAGWVKNTTFTKRLWADVHVFAHDGTLVSSETCALVYERPAGDGGDLFVLDCAVYEGATVTPGSATPRPDVRLVQYRLYGELDGRVFTDGLLHECVLKSDVVSH